MKTNDECIKPQFPLTGSPDIKLHFEQIKKYRNSNPSACIKSAIRLFKNDLFNYFLLKCYC